MAVIGLENDVGIAMLIFTMFIVLLWVATGRWAYLIFALVLFGAGAYVAAHVFSQVHHRVETWLHPAPTGQIGQGAYALAHGGVGGAGLGMDGGPGGAGYHIGFLTSDMIFAAIGDGMGLLGGTAVVTAFVLLVGAGLRIAQTARSDFSKLLATGLTAIVGFQAFYIMAGVIRLLPLTGITLPFVAYGGSSLVANYVLIAVLMRVSQEGTASTTEEELGISLPGESEFVRAT
jgi:peptidoglycan glycosyltransferase